LHEISCHPLEFKLSGLGVSVWEMSDYDGRTAVHLAASEGRINVLHYLHGLGADLNAQDRWGGRYF